MIARLRRAVHLQLLPLALGFVLLGAIVGARSWLIESQRESNDAVRAAFALDNRLVTTLSLAQDAETGQRGFLLTGEEPYLGPYQSAMSALPGEMEAIDAAVASNPERSGQIRSAARGASATSSPNSNETIASVQSRKCGGGAGYRAHRSRQDCHGSRQICRGRDAPRRKRRSAAAARRRGAYRRLAALGVVRRPCSVCWLSGPTASSMRAGACAKYPRRRTALLASNDALRAEIATREAAESQMRQMQKMEAVGQLTGGIAHDFNNMLAVIIGAMNLIAAQAGARRDRCRQASSTRRPTRPTRAAQPDRAAARLLAPAAAGAAGGRRQQARRRHVGPAAADARRDDPGRDRAGRRACGGRIADPSQLENAILNLAVNARDAMPDGGRLTIETANGHLDDALCGGPCRRAGRPVCDDRGHRHRHRHAARGASPRRSSRSSRPRRSDKGTGLGLSQVFGFVKQSGGHVKIYSEPGQGTTVKVYLPRHFGEEQAGSGPRSARSTRTGADRDGAGRRGRRSGCAPCTVDALRELGYTRDPRGRRGEALRMLDEHPEVALLFTDIVMPDMNGRKLAEEALPRRPDLKVLFTTGYTQATPSSTTACSIRASTSSPSRSRSTSSRRSCARCSIGHNPEHTKVGTGFRKRSCRGKNRVVRRRGFPDPGRCPGATRPRGLRRSASALPAPASRRCDSRNRRSGSRR